MRNSTSCLAEKLGSKLAKTNFIKHPGCKYSIEVQAVQTPSFKFSNALKQALKRWFKGERWTDFWVRSSDSELLTIRNSLNARFAAKSATSSSLKFIDFWSDTFTRNYLLNKSRSCLAVWALLLRQLQSLKFSEKWNCFIFWQNPNRWRSSFETFKFKLPIRLKGNHFIWKENEPRGDYNLWFTTWWNLKIKIIARFHTKSIWISNWKFQIYEICASVEIIWNGFIKAIYMHF